MNPPVDVIDAVRADERRRIAAEIREEAHALALYKRNGGTPTSPVSPQGGLALARFVETRP